MKRFFLLTFLCLGKPTISWADDERAAEQLFEECFWQCQLDADALYPTIDESEAWLNFVDECEFFQCRGG
jgi:hypothetical protein